MSVVRLSLVLAFVTAATCQAAQPPMVTSYKTVLIAGDGSLAVFDNAVNAMANRLRAAHTSSGADMQILSGSKQVINAGFARAATPENIVAALQHMRPRPGQGCFVYATSHGAEGFGIVLGLTDEAIDPKDLDEALQQGCGNAPTAIVMSGCFTGIYAHPPVTRPNRIILTAARPDRTSFGCHAGRTYTVFDKCLLDSFDQAGDWKQAFATARSCVSAEERRGHVIPSEPQAWFGSGVADLPLPTRP
jgi:hypothetical protein